MSGRRFQGRESWGTDPDTPATGAGPTREVPHGEVSEARQEGVVHQGQQHDHHEHEEGTNEQGPREEVDGAFALRPPHGQRCVFETYESLGDLTAADVFQRAGEQTPVFDSTGANVDEFIDVCGKVRF
jgi:hypothetical protein